jgi:hypothetical protein
MCDTLGGNTILVNLFNGQDCRLPVLPANDFCFGLRRLIQVCLFNLIFAFGFYPSIVVVCLILSIESAKYCLVFGSMIFPQLVHELFDRITLDVSYNEKSGCVGIVISVFRTGIPIIDSFITLVSILNPI